MLKQSTARNVMIFMTDSTDHVTGKTGLTLTVTLSKDGAAFGALGGSVTEVSSGWYKIALNTTDTNTLGDLTIHATGTAADNSDLREQVFSLLPGDAVTLQADQAVNVTKVGGTTQTARDLGASVLLSTGTGTGQLDFTAGVVKANLAQILGTALTETAGQIAAAFKKFFNVATPTAQADNQPLNTDYTAARATKIDQLDAAVTSRMASYTQPTGFLAATFPASVASPTNITAGTITTTTNLTNLPSIPANWLTAAGIAAAALNGKGDWNTVAPDNASVTAIKAKTDNLPLSPAATDGTVNVTKINSVAVVGTGVAADLWRA